jgi:hypothetical protein
VETLRDQVRQAAALDARFKADGKLGSVYVPDLIPPEETGGTPVPLWKAIISASDGRLFEVPFNIEGGKVKLAETSTEVFRAVRYLPLAVRSAPAEPLPLPIRARQFSTEVSAGQLWMYAPGGVHTITPQAGDGSAEVTLRIDDTTPAVLNASLAKINAAMAPQRAYIDKEHDEASGAAAWPEKFIWSDAPQPGVYLIHEPTKFGRDLIEGKIIRAFSPAFYSDADLPKKVKSGQHVKVAPGKRGSADNPARMTGLVAPAIGTLTNNPAFQKILPLWAKTTPLERIQ